MSNDFHFLDGLNSNQYTISVSNDVCPKCSTYFEYITVSTGRKYKACIKCGEYNQEENYTKPSVIINYVLISLYNGKNCIQDYEFIGKIFDCSPDEAKKIVNCFDINTLDNKTKLKLFGIAMRVCTSAQVSERARYYARSLRNDLYTDVKEITLSSEETSKEMDISKRLIKALDKSDFESIYKAANSIELPYYVEKNVDDEKTRTVEEQSKVVDNHKKSRVRSLFFRRKNS